MLVVVLHGHADGVRLSDLLRTTCALKLAHGLGLTMVGLISTQGSELLHNGGQM